MECVGRVRRQMFMVHMIYQNMCEILGAHGGECQDYGLAARDTVWHDICVPPLHRNLLPLSFWTTL